MYIILILVVSQKSETMYAVLGTQIGLHQRYLYIIVT